MVDKYVLRCIDISRIYKDLEGSFCALQSVTFSLMPGDILFLCGPNGSGKTTLLKVIAGGEENEEIDDGGNILCNLNGCGVRNWRDCRVDNYTWVPQDVGEVIPDHMKIVELVSLCKCEKVKEIAQRVEAEWLIECLSGKHKRRLVSEYSGGQIQLLVGIIALSQNKPVLLFDEVFKSLDVRMRDIYWQIIKNWANDYRGCAIIVSHDIDFALKNATKIMVLRNGKMVLLEEPSNLTFQQLAIEMVKHE